MVRTYRRTNDSSLGGIFGETKPTAGPQVHFDTTFSTPSVTPTPLVFKQSFDPNKKKAAGLSPSPDFSSTTTSSGKTSRLDSVTPSSRPQTRSKTRWRSQPSQRFPTTNVFSPSCQLQNQILAQCCLHQLQDAHGNVFYQFPQQAVNLGLCRGCRKIYATSPLIIPTQAKPAIDYSDLLNQKRKQEKEHRNSADIFAGPLKSSTSDGYLAGLPNYNDPGGGGDQSLAAGLSDLSKVLDRMKQNLSDPLTSRQTWSAPNGDPLSHNSRMSSRNGFTLESPFDKPRDLDGVQSQVGLNDPLSHLHGNKGSRPPTQSNPPSSSYSPSVYSTSDGGKRNQQNSYLKDLEAQILEQRARREQEKRDQNADWWEKKTDPAFTLPSPTKPHPSQTAAQRPDPRDSQQQYEDDLKKQIEMKKIREAEEKRKQREEEEKLEKRIQEQQERMKREYEEEVAKKRAKEEAKIRRQEEMSKRQAQIQKDAQSQRREIAERKWRERMNEKDRSTTERDGSTSPPFIPERDTDRGNSPPIPAMRRPNDSSSDIGSDVASGAGLTTSEDESRLSSNRPRNDGSVAKNRRRRSEVWEGLAEV